MFTYKYILVDPQLRKMIDLQIWEDEIIDSVHSKLPYANVEVYKEFYRFTTLVAPTTSQLQQIGRKIASNPHIGRHVASDYYGKDNAQRSGKLFKRKK